MSALRAFSAREGAFEHATALIEGALRALTSRGDAGLFLSGGSTPAPLYRALSRLDLNWMSVSAGLVDERWVERGHEASNALLVERTLKTNRALHVPFLPFRLPGQVRPEDAAEAAETHYRNLIDKRPVLVLGMGTDGHTASWFPGAKGAGEAMDADAGSLVALIDAAGCSGAGDYPIRITLTAKAFRAASMAVLLITGAEKRAVLENRSANLPIHHAERLLEDRLIKVWAP